MNFTHEDIKSGVTRDRVAIGASLADINPMSIDRETSFASIGGLTGHIRSLKEMIVFPLLYPEVFETFHISPPRGVLFHGPPGTCDNCTTPFNYHVMRASRNLLAIFSPLILCLHAQDS